MTAVIAELKQRVRDRGYELTKQASDLLVDRLRDDAGPGLPSEAVQLTAPSFVPETWSTTLAVTSVGTTWQWVYGDAGARGRPFDPHIDLDGTTFDLTTYLEVLGKDPNEYPEGEAFYFPQDHPGCQCEAAPVSGDEAFDPTGTGGSTTSLRVGSSTVTVTRAASAPDQIVPDWWQANTSPAAWAEALADVQ